MYTELQQRLVHRDALITMRQQLHNQLHALMQQPSVVASVQARLESLIATLTDELAALDAEIAATLVQDNAWAEAAARLQTITGVGLITTAWLLTATLNFTLCPTPEAATAYAGLAPTPHQSGTSVCKRPTIGHTGHARLRTVLYLASLSAAQHNPAIKPFYNRLRAAGKSSKAPAVPRPGSCCTSPGPWQRRASPSTRSTTHARGHRQRAKEQRGAKTYITAQDPASALFTRTTRLGVAKCAGGCAVRMVSVPPRMPSDTP